MLFYKHTVLDNFLKMATSQASGLSKYQRFAENYFVCCLEFPLSQHGLVCTFMYTDLATFSNLYLLCLRPRLSITLHLNVKVWYSKCKIHRWNKLVDAKHTNQPTLFLLRVHK